MSISRLRNRLRGIFLCRKRLTVIIVQYTFTPNVQNFNTMDPITLGLGGIGLASQLFGGIKSAQANKAAQKALNEQIEENQAIYNNNVNRSYLDTTAAKGALERIRKQYEKANDIADNRGVVTGASPEAVIAETSANNEALNDVTSQIAEQGTAYQDSQTNQYRQTSNQLAGAKIGMEQQKGQNAANLISNAGNLLGTAATLGVGGNTTGVIPSGTNAAIAARTTEQTSDLNSIKNSAPATNVLSKIFRV